MEKYSRATVQTVSDATVGGNSVVGNAVAKTSVHGLNHATMFDDTVLTNTLKDLSTASQQYTTEIVKKDIRELCSVTAQQKTASCQKETMALLNEKAFRKPINYYEKASVGIASVWYTKTAAFEIGKGPDPLKETYCDETGENKTSQ